MGGMRASSALPLYQNRQIGKVTASGKSSLKLAWPSLQRKVPLDA